MECRRTASFGGISSGNQALTRSAFIGSYELDMSRIYWNAYSNKKKDAVMAGFAGGKVRVQRNH
jgi:hypothetical protein